MTELEELRQDLATMTEAMNRHRAEAQELLARAAELETLRQQEPYIQARIMQICLANGYARNIAKIEQRIKELEGDEIKIPVVFLTRDQTEGADDVAEYSQGAKK